MRESCLVYCYSGIQSLFEVVLLYTFYTGSLRVSRDMFNKENTGKLLQAT